MAAKKDGFDKTLTIWAPISSIVIYLITAAKIPSHFEDWYNIYKFGADTVIEGHTTFWWVSLVLLGAIFLFVNALTYMNLRK